MDEKENGLIPAFEESLKCDIEDIGIDWAGLTIDTIFDNPIIDVIPIARAVKAIIKGGIHIRDRHLLNKTLVFLSELKANKYSYEQLKNYKEKICKSEKKFAGELERVIILLDKMVDEKKAFYLSRLFLALITAKITLEEFEEYSELVDRMFMTDLRKLENYCKEDTDQALIQVDKNDFVSFGRIEKNGIGEFLFGDNEKDINEKRFYGFNEYSQLFINIIFNFDREIKPYDNNSNFKNMEQKVAQTPKIIFTDYSEEENK